MDLQLIDKFTQEFRSEGGHSPQGYWVFLEVGRDLCPFLQQLEERDENGSGSVLLELT